MKKNNAWEWGGLFYFILFYIYIYIDKEGSGLKWPSNLLLTLIFILWKIHKNVD
jgi:hypothetical protein